MAKDSGSNVVQLLVLLLILSGAGGWNYKRNADIENAEVRPYRGYSDADLEQLIAAYGGEAERGDQALRARGNPKVRVRAGGLLGDQVDEFERVQRISTQQRALAAQATDLRVTVELLEQEQLKRAADRPVYKMIARRLVTIPAT